MVQRYIESYQEPQRVSERGKTDTIAEGKKDENEGLMTNRDPNYSLLLSIRSKLDAI